MALAAPGQLNLYESPSWGSRSVDCFEKLEQIGEGTYGQVYMAREIKTGEIVALKKIRMDNEREGFPITAIREIKILKKLHHENVIKLKEIVTSTGPEKDEPGRSDGNKYKGGIYMVFEYMDHDLTGLSDRPGMRFSVPQIKCYMRQLLTGLHYCHINQVLHRDIKGSNLLIDNEGNLKLADFGLARSFSNDHNANLTNRVITLWYRPPELLLGTTKYGPAVDMWSVGCIFAELLQGKPILPGKDEPEQLNKIFELCGAPDEVNWPGVSKYSWYNNFKPTRPMKRRVREVFRQFDRHAVELLEKMLTLILLREYLPKMHWMLNISGQIPCPVILRAYPNTSPLMSFRQRKSDSSKDSMKKQQNVRNYSIHRHTHAFLPSNNLVKCIHSFGQDLARACIITHLPWLLDQATTMGSLADHLEGQTDTRRVGIPVEDIIRTVEAKEEATTAVHILHKDEAPLTLQAACPVLALEGVAAVMDLMLQIILKEVSMGAPVAVEVPT
ncbi:hypothetical protein Syun_017868 [Stephania yunnanensis]|uniref:Protein kinase domain-containing protein n=1 Tax=Stephania yunnanensis TaxID=152371 RepID=A0AAP0P6A2_9MAGN